MLSFSGQRFGLLAFPKTKSNFTSLKFSDNQGKITYNNWVIKSNTTPDSNEFSQFNAAAINPDGDLVMTTELREGINVLDSGTFKPLAKIDCGGIVLCLAWSFDGKYVAAGMATGEIVKINPLTNQIIQKVKSQSSYVNALEFNYHSDRLLVGFGDGTVIIYSVSDLSTLNTLQGHTNTVYCCSFISNDTAATVSSDKTVLIWDLQSGKVSLNIKEHSDAVWRLAVSPDGRHMATGGADKSVFIYSIANSYKVIVKINCKGIVCALQFQDDDHVLSGIFNVGISLINIHSGQITRVFEVTDTLPPMLLRADLPAVNVRYQEIRKHFCLPCPSGNFIYFLKHRPTNNSNLLIKYQHNIFLITGDSDSLYRTGPTLSYPITAI